MPTCNPFDGLYFSTNWMRKPAGFPQRVVGLGRRSTRRRWSLERSSIANLRSYSVDQPAQSPVCHSLGLCRECFRGHHRFDSMSEVLGATLYGKHEIKHVALCSATVPFWLEHLLHQKIRLFLVLESFKRSLALRWHPILAVDLCKCAIWRWHKMVWAVYQPMLSHNDENAKPCRGC